MFVNEKFRNVTYYGMGPYESYIDKHRASVHGTFSADIDKLYVDYIRPQENGSHCDCDYVSLKNDGEVHMEGNLCARAGEVHMEGNLCARAGEVHMEGNLCARAGGVHIEGDF